MFVRTKKGRIFDCVVGEQMGKPIYYPKTSETNGYIDWNEVYNKSENIIDILEVGDYVNGWRVNRVEKEEEGTLLTVGTITSFVSRSETEPYLTQDYNEADKMCKLKSIVTKEQFSSMEYKVNE